MSLNRSWTCAALAFVYCTVIAHSGFTAEPEPERGPANVGKYDYPMWGGTPLRVNTPFGTRLPIDWGIGDLRSYQEQLNADPDRKDRRPPGSKNIKWCVPLGSQTFGNPIVANGRVFVGTNNGNGYVKRYPAIVDLGVLLCFDEQTGAFLWQHSNEKLRTGRVHDWPLQGVCSSPVVDGDRLWYVSNRGEVVCLDTNGFHDGEDDGPATRTWAPLFDIHTSYVEELGKWRSMPPRLARAFTEAGIQLPLWLSIHPEGPQRWLLGNSQRIAGGDYQWKAAFEVLVQEGELRVFTLPRQGTESSNQTTPLLTVPDTLLHDGLDRGEINASLREAFEAYGVQLARDYTLKTTTGGKSWALTDKYGDTDRSFRLWLKGSSVITAEMLVTPANRNEADVVWKVDMLNELGVSPHNMSNCSPLTVGNKLFICTSNGLDESHVNIPKPDAPSFLAMDRDTGEVLWSSNLPGKNILHAQWASPSYGVFQGMPQVIFPGGDGWVYSFDPNGDGHGGAKLLWKFDGNRKESEWILGGRGTRNNIIAFPAIYDGLVYITMGQDPEHGEGAGILWCVDPTKHVDGSDVSAELAIDSEGNVLPHRRVKAVDRSKGEHAAANPTSAVVWKYDKFDQNRDGKFDFEEEFHRSIGIPTIKDDILYVADYSGLFHCVDAKSGKVHWTHDMFATCWGSALVVDGKVYIGDEDGEVSIFRHSVDPNVAMNDGEPMKVIDMRNSVYMTPIVANNVLYVANKTHLFAIVEKQK